jgi:hypothetical protein
MVATVCVMSKILGLLESCFLSFLSMRCKPRKASNCPLPHQASIKKARVRQPTRSCARCSAAASGSQILPAPRPVAAPIFSFALLGNCRWGKRRPSTLTSPWLHFLAQLLELKRATHESIRLSSATQSKHENKNKNDQQDGGHRALVRAG